jgi:hypothetical protein
MFDAGWEPGILESAPTADPEPVVGGGDVLTAAIVSRDAELFSELKPAENAMILMPQWTSQGY